MTYVLLARSEDGYLALLHRHYFRPNLHVTELSSFTEYDMILSLATEIIIQIIKYLEEQRDINSICRTSRRFYYLFNDYLYQFNIKSYGGSAVLWAAKHGNESTARRILHLGFPVNTVFRTPSCLAQPMTVGEDSEIQHGITPLHIAGWKGHRKLVDLFLAIGANPEVQMRNGWTPLYLALTSGNEKIARTISWHITNLPSHLVDFKKQLSPLHVASRLGLLDSVRFFIRRGADINARDSHRNTPLHHALATDCRQLGYTPEAITMLPGVSLPSSRHIFKTVTEILDSGAIPTLEGFASRTAAELGALHEDERVRKLFEVSATDSVPKHPKPRPLHTSPLHTSPLHVGRSWMFAGQEMCGEQSLISNELSHLEHYIRAVNPRQVDRESIIQSSMPGNFYTESRMNTNQFHADSSDLSAFPVLGEIRTPMILNSQVHLGDNTWSKSKTKLLIANLVGKESRNQPATRHIEEGDPFPQLISSAERPLIEASKNSWTTFRHSEARSLSTNMPLKSESETKDSRSLKSAKTKGKGRWRPLML